MTNFLQKLLPEAVYQKLRKAFLFRPNDPNDLLQQVPQMHVKDVGVERIKGYRYPAPGSQPKPSIPVRNSEDELYDITFFAKDTRRMQVEDDIVLNTSNLVKIPNREMQPVIPVSRKPRPTFDYDPTGLRTARSVTQAAVDLSLEKIPINHWPRPEWVDHYDEIIADAKRKGIPCPPGRRYKYKNIPESYNQVSW